MHTLDFDSNTLPDGITLEIAHRVERDPDMPQANSFLDYVFTFTSGRLVVARTYLDTFSDGTEVGVCGCFEEGEEDNCFGPDHPETLEWPEVRQTVIALEALGFSQVLWPGQEEYVPVDLTALKIDRDDVHAFAKQATEVNGQTVDESVGG
jgi:hypothetical protein